MSSNRSPKLALIAFSLVLGACSFQFQAGMSAGARNQPRQAAQPTAAAATTPTPQATTTATTPATTARPTTPTPTAQVPRINGTNAFGNGKIGAFTGHAYVIPNTTTKMPDLSTMVPFASLLTDSFIVQSQPFSGGFPGVLMQEEWFAIRYEGVFEVPKATTYSFKLSSDDGAILYVDGQKVVDNDGTHTIKTVSGSKALTAGKHTLRLDYFQGARGQVALSLGIGEGANAEQHSPLVGVR